ncbi:MAG: hypothetical protein HQM08_13515 [Candidatus Riflebacteria bacterium]|nr:hypothetical protein [Candidatus Riflebacteria bacterium]
MKFNGKNLGLVAVSFIALSFNSHFAQAAKKTSEILQPSKVYAFKREGQKITPLPDVRTSPVSVKKTLITFDREKIYIGGYIVNASEETINHVRIFPTFLNQPKDTEKLSEKLNHDELEIRGKELRRFVIVRPIAEVKSLLENNIPIVENCILNCRLM